MASTLSPMRPKFSDDRWTADPSPEATYHPANLDLKTERPPRRRRPLRALIIFCLGIAAALVWQSHGDAARETIANASPQLGWLAPQAANLARAAPGTTALAGPRDVQQLKTMSLDLAAVRQILNQLTASQQRMADGIARLQEADQDILNKISVAPPQPAAAPARKPVPTAPPASSQAPPVR
jgi:hypothetical protein